MTNLSIRNNNEGHITPAAMPPGLAIRSLDDVMKIGGLLAKSGFFKGAANEAQAVAKILRGWELGIPPVAALETVYVIEGKTALAAHMIAALIKKSGRYNYRVKENSDRQCTILFMEQGEGVGESTFTMEDANKAQLLGKDVWKKYPKAMLYARAMSAGAKLFCPDVFGGAVYTPEELDANVNEDGDYIDVPVNIDRAMQELKASIAPTNPSQGRIRTVASILGVSRVAPLYQSAVAGTALQGKESKDLSDEDCDQAVELILSQWGWEQGAFDHRKHAQNALAQVVKVANTDSDEEIAIAWIAEVDARKSQAAATEIDIPYTEA